MTPFNTGYDVVVMAGGGGGPKFPVGVVDVCIVDGDDDIDARDPTLISLMCPGVIPIGFMAASSFSNLPRDPADAATGISWFMIA